jgi:catechol 2,3-dioxygenase-like lactoylglutathione lyase family enzyme
MIGSIGIVTLRVERWAEMVAFYRDQLGLRPRLVDEAGQYAMFDTGAARLALEGPAAPAFPRQTGHPPAMVNFETADLAAVIDELRGKRVMLSTDVKHGPGYDFVVIADPEGNEQIVYQRVKR